MSLIVVSKMLLKMIFVADVVHLVTTRG